MSGTIDGGGGPLDVLDYFTCWPPHLGVYVDLQGGVATNTGGVAQIEKVLTH